MLEEFGFNEEEQRETAKILMFPEDALFAYDAKVKAKDKSGKSISEVLQEAKTMRPAESEESHQEDVEISDEKDEEFLEEEETKNLTIETLRDCGIDYLDFTSDEIEDLMKHFDEQTIRDNIEFIESKNVSTDIFVHHIKMMYDKELRRKFEFLQNIGKETLDIYLNPGVLTKYTYDQLERITSVIRANGMDPKEIPLMAY